jgi:hypothetical protein
MLQDIVPVELESYGVQQLAPDRVPESRVGGLHLGQIVHWQAHAPMRFRLWLSHHRSLSLAGAR